MGSWEYILNRAREASTWAGLAVFLGMFGFDADIIARLTANAPAVATGIAAMAAIVLPSRFAGHTGLDKASAQTGPSSSKT